MKPIIRLILSALIPLHASASALSNSSDKVSCPELSNSFKCAQEIEKKVIELNKEIVSRKDGVLGITTVSDRLYEVKENQGLENRIDAAHFLVVGVSGDKRFVSLFVQYYEGNTWSLFDRNSGILTPVCGYPIFSPKMRYVAFSEMNLYTEMTPTCLQVYEIANASIKEVFDAKMGHEWGADEAEWITETKLIFKRVEWNPLQNEQGQPEFLTTNYNLSLDNGNWLRISQP